MILNSQGEVLKFDIQNMTESVLSNVLPETKVPAFIVFIVRK